MNDVFEATAEAHFDTGLNGFAAHGFGASGITKIQFRDANSVVAREFDLDFSTFGGTTFNDVLTQLNTGFTGVASFLIDFATGRLTVTPSAQFSGFKPFILSDTTNRSGTGTSLSSLYGLGDSHRMDAARGVAVASAIAKDSSKLALADLDLAAATGTPVLTPGDGAARSRSKTSSISRRPSPPRVTSRE